MEEKKETCGLDEMEASKRRSDRIKEISEEMEQGMDPAMAKILAEIAEKNKK